MTRIEMISLICFPLILCLLPLMAIFIHKMEQKFPKTIIKKPQEISESNDTFVSSNCYRGDSRRYHQTGYFPYISRNGVYDIH